MRHRTFIAAPALLCSLSSPALAQDAALPANPESSPQSSPPAEAPAPVVSAGNALEIAPADAPTPPIEIVPQDGTVTVPVTPAPVTSASTLSPSVAAGQASRLTADNIRYEGQEVVASGSEGRLVRFQSQGAELTAQEVRVNLDKKTVTAQGTVTVRRDVVVRRRLLQANAEDQQSRSETFRETLTGDNFSYDFGKQQGELDNARLQSAFVDISSTQIQVNGRLYEARNVVLRPGGLTPEERKIYGTPPLNLRAKRVTVTQSEAGARLTASQAGLYFKNTRLFPVPSYVLSRSVNTGRDDAAFQLSPRVSYSSNEGAVLTTQLSFPLRQEALALVFDLGASTRVGFRGGLALESRSKIGQLALRGAFNDLVTTQLTNRIELDRSPELFYRSPLLRLFQLPGRRRAGIVLGGSLGRFKESGVNRGVDTGGVLQQDEFAVRSTRRQAQVAFTTRAVESQGPYLELFGRTARYSDFDDSYTSRGYELGYQGRISSRIRGQFSYRATTVKGDTPFRFDRVEIPREIRATFDVSLTPRYLIPIDIRYDLDPNRDVDGDGDRDRKRLRDLSFGVLRSYKTFAYGATYQTARRELKLEFRQGF